LALSFQAWIAYTINKILEGAVFTSMSAASLFTVILHFFATFIPKAWFITCRLVMFLPFVVLIALVMRALPRLMPYLAVIHVLMDMSVAVMFLNLSI
jgi:hypothetical protein